VRKCIADLRRPAEITPCQPKSLDEQLLELERQRQTSSEPHEVNARMNELERQAGREELRSYPLYAAVNMIGLCNARCRFCYYGDDTLDRTVLRLADIQRMRWLRNVSTIDLYGGLGEPLLLADFADIVDWLREQNPGQRLHATSNGALLTEAVSRRLAGNLALLNISINAARPETYEHLMIGCKWDALMKNLRRFQEINLSQERPTDLTFSFVSSRANIEELPQLAAVAGQLGVKSVGVSHFCVNGVWGKRSEPRLSRNDTLYFHQELFDRCIGDAKAAFQLSGVPLGHPPLFSDAAKVQLGARIPAEQHSAYECFAPWQTVYVNPQNSGKWISCCCSINADHRDLTPLDLEDVDFVRTWNSSLFRMMRREVNRRPCRLGNCEFCRTHDKSSPAVAMEHMEMSIAATQQYHEMFALAPSGGAAESIAQCRQRIVELQAGDSAL
jgi:MoaA/NifB/PqqE/SkfB family radical SAM enzyme